MFRKIIALASASTLLLMASSCGLSMSTTPNNVSTQTSVIETIPNASSSGDRPEGSFGNDTNITDKDMITTIDMAYPLSGITKIEVDYDVTTLIIEPSSSDQITFLETTNSTNTAFYGKVSQESGTLKAKQNISNNSITGNLKTFLTIGVPLNFTGELDIDCDVSDITVKNGFSFSKVEISTDVGNIDIGAPITSNFSYNLQADVGDIQLNLPGDLAFSYNVKVDVGDITSDFFSLSENDFVSRSAQGSTSTPTTSSIEIIVNVGDVTLKKA